MNIGMTVFTKFRNFKYIKKKILKTAFNPEKLLLTCQIVFKNLSMFSSFHIFAYCPKILK